MFAEQHPQYIPSLEKDSSLSTEIWGPLSIALMNIFSSEKRLQAAAHKIELPDVIQNEGTQPFGFYTDLREYLQDLKYYGAKEARIRLHARLYSGLATMDQEARRKITTHPIPMHFVRPDKRSSHFFWRAIGRRNDWKTELLQRNADKPEGDEKDRFTLEINLMIQAFERLLAPLEAIPPSTWELLSETKKEDFLISLGYSRRPIEVTRHLTLLFPQLADSYGKTIECFCSPNVLHIYTPSEFHLNKASSFFYIKNISYIPGIGFTGLDQGLMSGYMAEDQKAILEEITGEDVENWNVEQLMTTVFTLKSELQSLPPEEVFENIKQIIPFKALEIQEYVNPDSCTENEYRNYIQVMQSIFDKELHFLIRHPEYAHSSQERNEVFSRYIAFALGLKDKLPKRKMLAKYHALLIDRSIALNPNENIARIDTSFAQIYHNLATVPLRLEGMIECSVIGSIKTSFGELKSAIGENVSISGNMLKELQNKIVSLKEDDNISAARAREFAELYNINPEWIGDVIKYYPNKLYCKAGDHQMHWVGQCGKHTMCLACNAQYNLDHGIVSTDENEAPATDTPQVSAIDALTGGGAYAKESLRIGDAVTAATSGFQIFKLSE